MKNTYIKILSFALLSLVIAYPAYAIKDVDTKRDIYQYSTPIQTHPRDLSLIKTGIVTEILKPDTVRIDTEGNIEIFKLDNIRMPVSYRIDLVEYLEKTLLNKKVGVYILGDDPEKRKDENDIVLCHLLMEDGTWVQSDIISKGLAWATSTKTSRDLVRRLYKYEDLARVQNLGFWADPKYKVKNNDTIKNTLNSFQVFEGLIRSTQTHDGYMFINISTNSRKGLTLAIDEKILYRFARFSTEKQYNVFLLRDQVGRKIRVRGWVEDHKGGYTIRADHPEQIEFTEMNISPIP
jgi:micrococcal nuclease